MTDEHRHERRELRLINRDLLTAEPSDQLIGIRCLKNRCDGVPAMNVPVPCSHREQMEVMVAEKALSPSGFLKLLHPSQRFKRLRAAVDEISHEDQGSGIGKLFQQAFQAFIAALQITDSNDRRKCSNQPQRISSRINARPTS